MFRGKPLKLRAVMNLTDHLTHNYQVAGPYQHVHEFKNYLLSGDPVVIREDGRFLGILTLHDIVSKPNDLVIDSFYDKPGFQHTDDILPVLLYMYRHNYEFLPALEGREFRGVISRQQLSLSFFGGSEEGSDSSLNDLVLQLKKEISLKNKFLAIIGHDVRNLFAQVLSSLELLDQRLQSTKEIKVHAALRLARRSAEQVNAAFEGMLLWARLATGQLPFQPQELNLNEQLNKIVSQFQLAGNVKNITIKNCLEIPMQLFADPNMLACILLNLVYNAIKFTPGGGEIWLNAKQDNNSTEIVVVDSGLGMSLQQRDELFSGGKPTPGTGNELGAGIGLVICKEFVEKHQGRLEFESEPGKGTRVIITFPNEKTA